MIRKAAILFLLLSTAWAQHRPPTLDPTYGMPLPSHAAVENKLPPDADWVWTRDTKDNQTVWFRKAFDLAKRPHKAALFITVDNFFTAYVNGKEVGKTEPTKTDEEIWRKVHRFDVTGDLKDGENVIAVIGVNAGGPAGLLARLEVDGRPALFSDWQWMQMESEPPSGWMMPGFKEVGWTGALRIAALGGGPWGQQIQGWPVPITQAASYLHHLPLKAVAYARLKMIGDIDLAPWQPTSGHLSMRWWGDSGRRGPWGVVVDFGKELTGRVAVSMAGSGNLQVQVGTGESSSEAVARPWTTNDLDLDGKTPKYTIYTAMRYAALKFPASASSVDIRVTFDHLYYPVTYKGSFDCSDPLLTKIWYTGAYTAHSCMQEDIWDAPKRDRMRWMGDLHVSGEVINNAFLDKFLMEQTLSRLRRDAQGGRPLSEEPKQHVNGIPGYSCAWVCGLADFYRHSGDISYMKAQHDGLISMLEFFRGEMDDQGLFADKRGEWPFVDWAPEFDKDTLQTRAATHMFLIKALREAVFMFNEMGDKASAGKYCQWAEELTTAAKAHFLADGTYGDRRQENAMAVYSGTADLTQADPIRAILLNLNAPAWKIQASPYYDNYVIFAMGQLGGDEQALKFIREFWGGMLAEGATSFWEGYDPSWNKNNFHAHLNADDGTGYFVSLCHGWSAGVTNYLTERTLGVRPTSGGFRTCEINPHLGDLKWASGTVPTPHGPLNVKVVRTPKGLNWTLHIPKGVTVTSSEWANASASSTGHVPMNPTLGLTGGDFQVETDIAR